MSWMRPRHPAPTNIYEGLVSKNVTEPTYTVEEAGWTMAYHPEARGRYPNPIAYNRPETPIVYFPPVRAETGWDENGNRVSVYAVPKPYKSG